VIRWTKLAVAVAPGGEDLSLMQRGSEFSIMVGATELMNSRRGGSEIALAVAACERLRDVSAPHVLIGGLGMGFTLRAALAELGASATITVAELVPEVVSWARGPLAEVFGGSLEDPRLRIIEGDVGEQIRSRSAAYDAIVLDVDNGPDGLVRSANARLYDESGLAAVRGALRPGGVLAVWSASPSAAFVRRLRAAGFDVEEVVGRSGLRRGARHVVWIATPA
jgi:spermidine synthase